MIFSIASLSFNHSYGVPVMLMGLLLGMAMSQLYRESEHCKPGIDFASSSLLKVGIVLIGFRFTATEFTNFNLISILALSAFAFLSILFGVAVAHLFGLPKKLGILSGSAVGICGASAALAVATVLDPKGKSKHLTVLTVATVTSLSSLAMLIYPVVGKYVGLGDTELAYLLGATIHDVAQVVGAGYSVSNDVGDKAVLVKLTRILNLLPIVILIALLSRKQQGIDHVKRAQVIPTFLIAFIVVAALNMLIVLPEFVIETVKNLSSQLILVSIVAIGLKTDMRELINVGYLPLILICLETVFLFSGVLAAVYFTDFLNVI